MKFNSKKVYIYYPSKITGGAEFLLKTAAEMLSVFFEVIIVDIENGWLSLNVKNVDFVIIDNSSKLILEKNDILITTANLVRYLDVNFQGDFKLIAWVVQINNIIPVFPKIGSLQYKWFIKYLFKETLLKSEYKALDKLTKYLENENSLYSMDDACNDIFHEFFNRKIEKYLPVVIPNEKILELKKTLLSSTGQYYCVWLGRLDNDFKNPILEHVLISLNEYAMEFNVFIVFDIIGMGPGLSSAKKCAKKLKFIKINFLGEMRGAELIGTIKSHDVGFAMGTSALEIAGAGVPVVLLDAAYGKVPTIYKYQWLFESTGYCIGRSIDTSKDKTLGNKKLIKDLFNDLKKDRENIRTLCFEHVVKFHSIDALKEKLLLAINETNSSFKYMQSLDLFKKPYWYSLKRLLK